MTLHEERSKQIQKKTRQSVREQRLNLSEQRVQKQAFLRPPHALAVPASPEEGQAVDKKSRSRGFLYKSAMRATGSRRSVRDEVQSAKDTPALQKQGSRLLALAERLESSLQGNKSLSF